MKRNLILIIQILIISVMTNLNAQDKKTFAPSDKVVTERVSFKNRFGITLVADLYRPKNAEAPLLTYSSEIRSAVLLVHGEKAHSRYFSEDAFKKLKGDNKELLIVPGSSHVDLYDNVAGVIPYDRIEKFIRENMK